MAGSDYEDMSKEQLKEALTTSERDVECFRELAEHIPEVFWMTDVQGTQQIYISPAYEKIYGHTCASLYDQPVQRLNCVHPDDRERVQTAFDQDAARGDYDEVYRIVRPDEEIRWIRDRAWPVEDDAGRVYRLAGFAIDMTRQQNLEDARQQQHHQMSALNRLTALGMLGAGLAHEISQPLTAARGFLWRAMKGASNGGGLPDEVAQPLERANDEVTRATETVRKLREFVRFGRPSDQNCHFGDVARDAARLIEIKARAMGVSIELSPRGLDEEVVADPLFCQRILLNLMDNSLDAFSQRETASPRIALQLAAVSDEFMDVVYYDNAGGLDEQSCHKLFDPFYSSKKDGLGLGLAASRSMAESLGGSLTLGDEPVPRGSFILRLRRKPPTD